jgi:exopolyphosphatase / guanosine-5'-triphosphate,3'-diphosphate pyrophosphatase
VTALNFPDPLTAGAAVARDQRIAAIDIGSNSVRQIVADVSPNGGIRVIDEMKAMPRLGQGVDQTGRLSETSMELAVSAITRMATLARQFGAERIEVVATSAVRDAGNGPEFSDRIALATGLPVRILSGEAEARLSFRSALAHFELGAGRTVVMDIGGGSLELVLAKEGVIERLASLPYGAIRLTEQFLQPEIRPRAVRALRSEVRAGLRAAAPVKDWRGATVIGSGGTFTNLAGIVLSRHGLTNRSPHGARVSRVDLEHVLDWLQSLSSSERANVAGLNPQRADIIVAGLAVAAEVLARFDPRDLIVSGYGIREGILLEAARISPVIADPGAGRERSVREFAERCHFDARHASHVQQLALQLFDALAPALALTAVDRRILADAALLHEVGYHINYEKHHKHSYHLIVHAELLGMTPLEQAAIALVARYHRGSEPKRSHKAFEQLDRAWRQRIRTLSAILRFADGFDRGHVGAITRLQVARADGVLRVTAVPDPEATAYRLELWGAARKKGLLESVLALPIDVMGPDGQPVVTTDDDGD